MRVWVKYHSVGATDNLHGSIDCVGEFLSVLSTPNFHRDYYPNARI